MGSRNSCPAKEREEAAKRQREAEEAKKRAEAIAEAEQREKKRRAKLQLESLARDKYREAMKLWDEAWDHEADGDAGVAEKKFNGARYLFVEANRLHPENNQYSMYAKLSQYKIEGDAAFNEALKLHEEANTLVGLGQYVEATKKYTLALEKYRRGVESNQKAESSRFNDCINIVNESLDSVKDAIRTMHTTQQLKVLQGLRKIVNEKQGAQVVNEKSGIDIVFQFLKDKSV